MSFGEMVRKNEGSSNVHVNQQVLLWNSAWDCSCLMGSSVHQLPYYRPIISSHIHQEQINRTENVHNWIKPIESWVSRDMAPKIYSSFCLRNQIRHRWDRKDSRLIKKKKDLFLYLKPWHYSTCNVLYTPFKPTSTALDSAFKDKKIPQNIYILETEIEGCSVKT